MQVRAFFTAATVPGEPEPWNTLQLKVYYPAAYGDSFDERNMGFIPADNSAAPYPVVIIMPGSNCHPESYGWLARNLSARGLVCVTFSWIKQDMPGYVSLSPGFDLRYLKPETFGQAPSSSALPTLLKSLADLQAEGLLAGLLDLNKVILGGHSAGGNAALLNANRDWFPQLRGGFSYAAHSGASTQVGFAPDTLLPLAGNIPLLIMGGTRDGVIAASAGRYGDAIDSAPTERIERTFDEALNSGRGDCHLAIIEGANHFCFTDPYDGTTGRPFLDWRADSDEAVLRDFFLDLIGHFIDAATSSDGTSHASLESIRDHKLIRRYARK